jgi:hypothetical protein
MAQLSIQLQRFPGLPSILGHALDALVSGILAASIGGLFAAAHVTASLQVSGGKALHS